MKKNDRRLTLFAGVASLSTLSYAQEQQMNVLFVIVDDLRPELGCYGTPYIQTPNIDRWAKDAVVFDNAYCNIPVSGASRASLLTGLYPSLPNRFTNYTTRASHDAPDAIPISAWFKQNGYYTVSDGKVFHHIDDFAETWSEAPYRKHPDGYDEYWAEYNRWELWLNESSANHLNPKTMRGPFCEAADVPDTAYDDGKLAQRVIADLKRLKEKDQPFFLACGFWKPHLPFNAPKKYWDLYKREEIPKPSHRSRPQGLPNQVQNSREILAYGDVGDLEALAFQRKVKHGYYACVSYVDALFGQVLQALDDLQLKDSTIVVLIGDHGWNLGEHNFIGKHNLMKTSCQVPMIISVPGHKGGRRQKVVDLVGLYPTLCDLCGLGYPANGQLQGDPFTKLLYQAGASDKQNVYIQWQGGEDAMSEQFNYAEWRSQDGLLQAQMLFDHRVDPEENNNCADRVTYKPILNALTNYVQTMSKKVK